MVQESLSILASGQNINGFGELLHEAWMAKRGLSSKVSNPEVDALYEEAVSAGAIGGKLTGAGGGGFLLLFVPPPLQTRVRERLSLLINVPFKFDLTGSQIIYFDPQEDYSDLEKVLRESSRRLPGIGPDRERAGQRRSLRLLKANGFLGDARPVGPRYRPLARSGPAQPEGGGSAFGPSHDGPAAKLGERPGASRQPPAPADWLRRGGPGRRL